MSGSSAVPLPSPAASAVSDAVVARVIGTDPFSAVLNDDTDTETVGLNGELSEPEADDDAGGGSAPTDGPMINGKPAFKSYLKKSTILAAAKATAHANAAAAAAAATNGQSARGVVALPAYDPDLLPSATAADVEVAAVRSRSSSAAAAPATAPPLAIVRAAVHPSAPVAANGIRARFTIDDSDIAPSTHLNGSHTPGSINDSASHNAPIGHSNDSDRRRATASGHVPIPSTDEPSVLRRPSSGNDLVGISLGGSGSGGLSAALDSDLTSDAPVVYASFFDSRKPWVRELQIMISLALPMIGSYTGTMLIQLTSLLFVGRLGSEQLASAALAIMFCNVTGNSLGIGLLSAMDTLCSQSFGAENYPRVGIVVQRSFLILGVLCIPIIIIWLCSEALLIAVGQDPVIAAYAGHYVRVSIAGLPGYFAFEIVRRYLQVQSIVKPMLVVTFAHVAVNVFLNYLLVNVLEWGLSGAALSLVLTYWSQFGVLLWYTLYAGYHRQTWYGWSLKEASSEWKEYFKLGLPGAAMVCAEWWGFEIHALVAGLLGTVPLAAQTLLLNTIAISFMIPLGIGIAATTRVGNLLGANKPHTAQLFYRVAVWSGIIGALMEIVILIIIRKKWGYVFTNEDDVVDLVSEVIPIICSFLLFDNIQGTSSGILKGCGRQLIGAGVNLGGYWLIGLPLGIGLAFRSGLGIRGQWIGLSIASFLIACIYTVVLWRMDWVTTAHVVHTRETAERLRSGSAGNSSSHDPTLLASVALDPLAGVDMSPAAVAAASATASVPTSTNGGGQYRHHALSQIDTTPVSSAHADTPGAAYNRRRPSMDGAFSPLALPIGGSMDFSLASSTAVGRAPPTRVSVAPVAVPTPVAVVALPTNIAPLAPPPAAAAPTAPASDVAATATAAPLEPSAVSVAPIRSSLRYQHNYPAADSTSPPAAAGGGAGGDDPTLTELERELARSTSVASSGLVLSSPSLRALAAADAATAAASALAAGTNPPPLAIASPNAADEQNLDALEAELRASGVIHSASATADPTKS